MLINVVFALKYAFNKVFGNEIIFAVLSRLKFEGGKTYLDL